MNAQSVLISISGTLILMLAYGFMCVMDLIDKYELN